MTQYGLIPPPWLNPMYGSQPRISARNSFINSTQLHINFVPNAQVLTQPQDARGLEGADVFGPAPARSAA